MLDTGNIYCSVCNVDPIIWIRENQSFKINCIDNRIQTHIVGNINVDGSLRVDGTVDGDILKPVLHAGFS